MASERKHDLPEEYLAKTKTTQGLFLILVGRADASQSHNGFTKISRLRSSSLFSQPVYS
jgi:hypothetical protein